MEEKFSREEVMDALRETMRLYGDPASGLEDMARIGAKHMAVTLLGVSLRDLNRELRAGL